MSVCITKSSLLNITCGVPQGSVLGPVLFLVYKNGIVNVSRILQLILFADDTNIFTNWFVANKLSLNVTETKSIIFCSSRKRCTKTQVKLRLNDDVIEQVCSVKFLGVYTDERLSWDNYIQQVASKLSKNIGILAKLKIICSSKSVMFDL